MPTYEYECPKCPRVFEIRQRITEAPLQTCDRCGGPVRRLLSAAPFILKGEGWYVTDYPSEARKKAASAESGTKESAAKESGTASKDTSTTTSPEKTSPKNTSKDGGSAESKPAASSESKSSTERSSSPPSTTSKPSAT